MVEGWSLRFRWDAGSATVMASSSGRRWRHNSAPRGFLSALPPRVPRALSAFAVCVYSLAWQRWGSAMAANPQDPPVLMPADAQAVPTWRAAYSDRTSAMMAAFSQLAYVPFTDEKPGSDGLRPEQPGGREQLAEHLRGGGFELKAVFNLVNVQAFIAVNADEFAVLAFSGTANGADWEINLNALRMPMPRFEAVGVHIGIWQAYAAMTADIKAAVDHYIDPDLGLYVTGHSL